MGVEGGLIARLRASAYWRWRALSTRFPLEFGMTLTLSLLALFQLRIMFRALSVGYPSSDYKFAAAAARAGFRFGWSRIYDHSLPRWEFTELPGPPPPIIIFVPNPPPFVWLVAPFAELSGPAGYMLWALLMLGCMVAASQLLAGPGFMSRLRSAAVMLGLLPAIATVIYGQITGLLILALAAIWALTYSRRDVLAGAILALGVVKPHLLLLVPFTLLIAGRWRIFASWAVVAAALALASVASLGVDGTRQYLAFITSFDSGQRGSYSLAALVGPGPLFVVARVAAVIVAAAIAYLGRGRGATPAIVAGAAGSLLFSGYLNWFDLALYAPLILMLVREGAAWRAPVIAGAVLWVALEVAISTGPLVVLLEVLFLLALLQPLSAHLNVTAPADAGAYRPKVL